MHDAYDFYYLKWYEENSIMEHGSCPTRQEAQVVNVIRHKGSRFAAAHGQFSRIRQIAPMRVLYDGGLA